MSGLLPVAVYGLKVHPGDDLIPALQDFPATFRLTMAAIDPSAEPNDNGGARSDQPPRATLKLFYNRSGLSDDDDSDEDEEEENYLKALLQAQESEDDESSSDDEELNGGPSDPSKSKKARKQAAAAQIMTAFGDQGSEDEMDTNGINGSLRKKNKGKGKAISADDEESSDEEDGDEDEMEVVVCTLDPQKNYQQPLDLTIGEDQRAFFKVSGTHTIYLTGNYVVPAHDGHKHDDFEDDSDIDYNLSPDEDELDGEEESDELDDLEDPRITEVDTDEEETPKLVKNETATQKGKNKRVAEDLDQEPANLDEIIEKSLKQEPAVNGEQKLSKKQLKKMKNNAGKAVETKVDNQNGKIQDLDTKEIQSTKGDKKVQFAKNLEQGPSGTSKESKADAKAGATEPKAGAKEPKSAAKIENKVNGESAKASLGPKTLQGGVKVDDKTLGKGPACKKGNKVGMRYIGKLMDGKVFDANKKGPPFKFTLGSGEVIKGWDIGVTGMSVGGERRIEIPANLGYGSKSMPGIPANSTLKFDVKLLEIN